ncbi:DNA polymerase III subunit chi [Cellvibrio zantedeschiae]|uniref:DNA polymerase III subunit chi n=1 Tax=Cellvibrio zantedeschiae TaxID=1237077 RepID=A0ABQ3AVC3_9GAMM|nr:DNA polymerase III subunit chi [Cellvibrio zantedeschiae]GGY69031.1 DNA polymerase III subunit chi [Cellvibrio zantedeschiae]
MTQIDFHILQDASVEARWLYVCRFIEKVERLGHSILVVVDSQEAAQELDDLLWSFKPESFIAHQIIGGGEEAKVEITYATGGGVIESGAHQDVLINLSSQIPEFFSRFARLAEIVIQEPKILENTREHYRFYKQRGYPITQHQR